MKRAFPAPGADRDDDVLTLRELADLLKTSVRTIARRRRAGVFGFPEIDPPISRQPRWYRQAVEAELARRSDLRRPSLRRTG